jgi:hypothetical protein
MTYGAEDETPVPTGRWHAMSDAQAGQGAAIAPHPARESTGDAAVDEVLGQLEEVTDEPLDSQIEVGERVHRVLQARLADLGKE